MKTVLYVDDSEEMIEIVKIVLKDSGYQILSQTEGQATLDFCAKEDPDLVLLDLNMPGMDGFEVTRKLREQGVYQSHRCIICVRIGRRQGKSACYRL